MMFGDGAALPLLEPLTNPVCSHAALNTRASPPGLRDRTRNSFTQFSEGRGIAVKKFYNWQSLDMDG